MLQARGPARSTPLFGRSDVLDGALRALSTVSDGAGGRLLLITGPGGVGKTTFLQSFADGARQRGCIVLEGRALPMDPPRPFSVVEDLLRAAREERQRLDQLPPSSRSLPLFAAPFDVESEASSVRGEAAEDPAGSAEADWLLAHLASPPERVDADRSAFLGRLSGFFLELARHRPLLLALDDLQFADDSSLEFLRQFVSLLADRRVLVVATLLPEDEVAPRAGSALDRLRALPGAETAALRPMTETDLADFVRWLLDGRDPGHDAVMRWFSQTEGNPLFTEYLVRASTGFSARGGDTDSVDLSELLRARVGRLTDAEQRVLVHAAVLGKEFDFATLDVAAGHEEERLSEHLERLVHDGILREKGGEVYEFVSERVRADVYAQLTETRRRLLHRKIARALLARDGVKPENLFELARQSYLGRDDAKAVELNRRAADLAARTFAFETAAVHLERALECQRRLLPPDLGTETRLMIELGRSYNELGDLHRSESTLLDATASARNVAGLEADLALALLGLAQTRSDAGQYVSARDLALEAYHILESLGHRRGLMAAHRVLGVALWRLGELDAAEEHHRSEVSFAETDGTPSELGHAMIDLANTYTLIPGRLAEADRLYDRATRLFAEIKSPSAEARVRMNRALLHHYAGEKAEALEGMTEALAAAERSRSPIWIGYCSLNLAQFLVDAGQLDRAQQALDRAQGILEPLGDLLALEQVAMIRGMLAEARGSFDEAEGLYADALRKARDLSLGGEMAEMEFRQASLASRRGDLVKARRLLGSAQHSGLASLRPDLSRVVQEFERRLADAERASAPGQG